VIDLDRTGDLHDRLLEKAVQFQGLGRELPQIDGDPDVTAKLVSKFG